MENRMKEKRSPFETGFLKDLGKNLVKVVLSLSVLMMTDFHFPNHATASFEDTGVGARASGLGGAFTPLADDIHALYYNPAGLVYLKQQEFSTTYALLHPGLTDGSSINSSYVAYGHPASAKIGSFGISFDQLNVQSFYRERAITIGYARKVSKFWAAGINLKQLNRKFTTPDGQTNNQAVVDLSKTDPVFARGSSRSNVGLDFGFLYRPYHNYSFGIMFQNINEPNMSISDSKDRVPRTIRSGLAFNRRGMTLLGELDMKQSIGNGYDLFFNTAVEQWWTDRRYLKGELAARGALGFGSRSFSQISTGFSYRWEYISFDYAFLMPLGGLSFGTTQGNHRFSLTLKFGRIVTQSEYEQRMKTAEKASKKALEELEAARKESEDLMKKLDKLKKSKVAKAKPSPEKAKRARTLKETDRRFNQSMNMYWRRKSQGASLTEKIAVLTRVINEFSGTPVDLTTAEKELNIARSDRAKAEVDLSVSWSYYQKIVARGANVPERIQILSRMIKRFARTGVELDYLKDELDSLKGRGR